jgi:hypothetical protein
MVAPNTKGQPTRFLRLVEVFEFLGPDFCRAGVTAETLLSHHRQRFKGTLYGPSADTEVRNAQTDLNHYREGSTKATKNTRYLFVPVSHGRYNLRKFVLADQANKEAVETQALAASKSSSEGELVQVERTERERSGAATAFKQGLTDLGCEICGFDFRTTYGHHGAGFVEAHHIVPLANGPRSTDPDKGFAAVCSNCHSMLHYRKQLTLDELREIIVANAS